MTSVYLCLRLWQLKLRKFSQCKASMACCQCHHQENAPRGMDQPKVKALALDNNEITPGSTVKQTAMVIVIQNKLPHAKQIIVCQIVCSLQQQTIIAVGQSAKDLIGIKEVRATRTSMGDQTAKANRPPIQASSLLILLSKMFQENHRLKLPLL